MSMESGHGLPAWDAGGMRASDADRERAVEVLNSGFAEGRLPKDEYDARVHHAYTVPTRGDLEQVTAQLPGGGPGLYSTGRYGTSQKQLNHLAVASLACGVGQLIAGPLSTIPAVVLGHVARRQIRRTGEDGAGPGAGRAAARLGRRDAARYRDCRRGPGARHLHALRELRMTAGAPRR